VDALSNLLQLIRNENMKIYRRPRTWLMMFIVVAIVLTLAVALKTLDQNMEFGDAIAFMNFAGNLSFLAFLFAVVIAAEIVAGEFTWGTIKLLLIRPASRSKILLSKYVAVLMFLLGILVLLFFVSFATGLVVFGLPDEPGNGPRMSDVLQQYGFRLIDYVVNVTFAFMLSAVFRSSNLAIGLSFTIMFLSSTVMTILIQLKYGWAKYILYANTDLSIYFNGRKPPFPDMTLGFSVTMIVLYYIAFMAIAWITFRKRDVAG